MPTTEDVQAFWEQNPLWSGESAHAIGTPAFFDEHSEVVVTDCFAGHLDERVFPARLGDAKVLDLGCGIGFWTIELWRRGCRDLTAADLTNRAVELTRRRCDLFGVEATVRREDAEQLSFADETFTHVNCQGVIHHTPSPERAVSEIARVLAVGGTASISVYHRNIFLTAWPLVRPLAAPLALAGRGRERIAQLRDPDEIVRMYDGAANPIGVAYTKSAFRRLLEPHFEVERLFLHFFPARALPVGLVRPLHRLLDRTVGFMVYANVRKLPSTVPRQAQQ